MRLIDADELLRHQRKMQGFGISTEDDYWTFAVHATDIKNAPTIDPERLRPQGDLVDKIASFLEQDENWEALKTCWLIDGRSDDLRNLLHVALATDTNVLSKWIHVTERLPDVFENVLTYEANRRTIPIQVTYLNRHNEWANVIMSGNVTHWMPLPEPPERERKGDADD